MPDDPRSPRRPKLFGSALSGSTRRWFGTTEVKVKLLDPIRDSHLLILLRHVHQPRRAIAGVGYTWSPL